MSRLFQQVPRRGYAFALAVVAVGGLLASSAAAQNDLSFGLRSPYNGVPNAGSNMVIYNLPASGSIYAGEVNTTIDLTARFETPGGEETASAFGLIATLSGSGEVTFNPPPIVDDENNLGNATNPLFNVNSSFDIRYANTGVQGGGLQEIDIIALEEVALQNNLVSDGDGLASIPIRVAPGATGTFNVNFDVSPNYTGFVKTIAINDTQFLTNAANFPHANGTIEVRRSRKGDLNGDNAINFADIGGFVGTLSSVANYQSQFPWLRAAYISDINEDNATNFADIGGFVALLANPPPSPAAVPEPATLSLVGMAALAIAGGLAARRRNRIRSA